jgi:hypothetical protein
MVAHGRDCHVQLGIRGYDVATSKVGSASAQYSWVLPCVPFINRPELRYLFHPGLDAYKHLFPSPISPILSLPFCRAQVQLIPVFLPIFLDGVFGSSSKSD